MEISIRQSITYWIILILKKNFCRIFFGLFIWPLLLLITVLSNALLYPWHIQRNFTSATQTTYAGQHGLASLYSISFLIIFLVGAKQNRCICLILHTNSTTNKHKRRNIFSIEAVASQKCKQLPSTISCISRSYKQITEGCCCFKI